MSDFFYLQDSRSNVGTGAMWWAKDGAGYTTSLDRAELFTRERALKQFESRETDLPWQAAYIDERAHRGVDCQTVHKNEGAEGEAFYAFIEGDWNGNDLIWLTRSLSRSSDLGKARTFTREEISDLLADEFHVTPMEASYIEGKARRLISASSMNHREALRGVHLKLPKIKRQRLRRYLSNCAGCGRFLSQVQVYQDCPNCGADNRP